MRSVSDKVLLEWGKCAGDSADASATPLTTRPLTHHGVVGDASRCARRSSRRVSCDRDDDTASLQRDADMDARRQVYVALRSELCDSCRVKYFSFLQSYKSTGGLIGGKLSTGDFSDPSTKGGGHSTKILPGDMLYERVAHFRECAFHDIVRLDHSLLQSRAEISE